MLTTVKCLHSMNWMLSPKEERKLKFTPSYNFQYITFKPLRIFHSHFSWLAVLLLWLEMWHSLFHFNHNTEFQILLWEKKNQDVPLMGTAHTCYNALYLHRFEAWRFLLQVGGTAAVNSTSSQFGLSIKHQHSWFHYSNEECSWVFPFPTKWKFLHHSKKNIFFLYLT